MNSELKVHTIEPRRIQDTDWENVPEEPCYIIRPVVWEHHQEETHRYENHARQFHAHEMRPVENNVQRCIIIDKQRSR